MVESNIDYESIFKSHTLDSAVDLSVKKAQEYIDKEVDNSVKLWVFCDRIKNDYYIDYDTSAKASV
jgi:hypothetical protein